MASVKKAWIRKYGKEEGLRRWSEHKKNFGKTKEELREIHGDEYVEELSKKKATFTEDYYIDKYGEIEGKKRWNEVLNKKLKTQKENFKNKKWKNGRTLEEYQERYGVDVGYKKWSERNRVQSYKVSKQRYIDEYGEEFGSRICKDIKDNNSLKSFQERYGDEIGKKRYEENCKKCGITLDKMQNLYGKVDGERRYKEWIYRVTKHNENNIGVSKSSQELFWSLYEEIENKIDDDIYFAELNNEYPFYQHLDENIKLHKVDFKCGQKIIEFDCDYWHDEDNDRMRDEFLESKGYDILRVKYEDYIKDNKMILNKCMEFIYEKS